MMMLSSCSTINTKPEFKCMDYVALSERRYWNLVKMDIEAKDIIRNLQNGNYDEANIHVNRYNDLLEMYIMSDDSIINYLKTH